MKCYAAIPLIMIYTSPLAEGRELKWRCVYLLALEPGRPSRRGVN